MKAHSAFSVRSFVLALFLFPAFALAQQLKPIDLPAPHTDGGKPLMQALKDRHSTREFSSQKLSPQTLSDLLWAAFGINRPETGKRTAPSSENWQEMDVYAAMADGLYLYDAKGNKLDLVVAEDIRGATGGQAFIKDAPLNLVYVADLGKTSREPADEWNIDVAADAAFIAQNVYLLCASEGLAVVVRSGINRPALAKAMKLRPDQRILLAQTVGYPKK